MQGLALEEQVHCPDGVEWTQLADRNEAKLRGYRYSTDRREFVRVRMVDLEQPLVTRFVNARIEGRSDDGMAKFLGRYGFPVAVSVRGQQKGFMSADDLEDLKKRVRRLLRVAGSVPKALAIPLINDALSKKTEWGIGISDAPPRKPDRLRLVPRLDVPMERTYNLQTPMLVLGVESLFDYMVMECAFVATVGARTTACAKCRDLYLTGPLTWRRSHSVYCSDKCRVSAMRKRQAKARMA
jgi:hypothetical protein